MLELNKLTIEEKIGQMFIIGLQENQITKKTIEMIQKYKIGGIILYKKNYENYNEMLQLINKIKQINSKNKIPIFISIDQEGGRVNRMPSEIHNIKNATYIANTYDIQKVKQSGAIIGKMLKNTGINMNYAPVLDIRRFEEGHAIGNRCYGKNKEEVSQYGIEVMKQMQNEGIISVVKHFPGHGTTKKDSHFRIPRVNKKIEDLEKDDMVPFEKAIENGADCIMIGHLIIEDVDKKYPASLSKEIIQKYLKQKYNYNGIVMTDDLKMWAIQLHYNIKRATIRAINSGDDIIMLGLSYKKIKKIIKTIVKKVKNKKIELTKIEESVEKIVQIKEKYNIEDIPTDGMNVEEINKQIDLINEV